MRFGIVAVAVFGTAALLIPHTAEACTCSSIRTFDQQVKWSPLVIAGRIAATLPLRAVSNRTDFLPGSDVAAIDVDVIAVIRGKEIRQRLRIWDQFVGGSCSIQLEKLEQGMPFLQTYLSDSVLGDDKTTQYSSASVDLDGDGMKETVVYVSGQHWCGSGGCHLLVLKSKGTSYEVVGRTPITRLPIRVLTSKTHGWSDIGVWVQGGGIQPGYEAVLPFDGTSYPRNPSTPPSRPVAAGARGKVLIPRTAQGVPLYQ